MSSQFALNGFVGTFNFPGSHHQPSVLEGLPQIVYESLERVKSEIVPLSKVLQSIKLEEYLLKLSMMLPVFAIQVIHLLNKPSRDLFQTICDRCIIFIGYLQHLLLDFLNLLIEAGQSIYFLLSDLDPLAYGLYLLEDTRILIPGYPLHHDHLVL